MSTIPTAPVLKLRDTTVRRDGFHVGVAAMDLGPGDVAALLGPSGCGKSSWLRGWLLGQREIQRESQRESQRDRARQLSSDSCSVEGQQEVLGTPWPAPATDRWREMLGGTVTVLLQDPVAALDPLVPVGQQIHDATKAPGARCVEALSQLGVTSPQRIVESLPHQISGGQAQRVLLAIAMIRGPKLLIADEPTAGLDGESIAGFVAGLKLLRETHGTAVLLATHDLELVTATGAKVWAFDDGWFAPSVPRAAAWPAFPALPRGGVVFRATALRKAYGGTKVLAGVDLELHRGEIVAVVGPSGCGKSTLARIVTGHLQPDEGAILESQSDGRAHRQLLFQDAFASLTPGRSVQRLLAETALPEFDIAAEAAAVELPAEALQQSAAQLSGGERRRVALLRALSVGPKLLVLDEPTQSLDPATARSVLNLLGAAQKRWRFAVLLITHDLELATHCAQRVLSLDEGCLR